MSGTILDASSIAVNKTDKVLALIELTLLGRDGGEEAATRKPTYISGGSEGYGGK